MRNIFFKIYIIFPIFFGLGRTQDSNFCDNTPILPSLPIPTIPIDGQYQATIEKNSNGITEEIQEIFDGKNNVGIVTNFAAGIKTQTYSYYGLNELLLVSGKNCKVYKLNESYELSPFQVININGTEHILSPLNSISNIPGLNFNYIGTNITRNIPVNVWRACLYSFLIKTWFKITIYYTDKNWSPAAPIESFPSIPVQIEVETKKDSENKTELEFYSVTKFKPFLMVQEEDYFTPSGVFCPGRTNLKISPKIPQSFMFVSQIVTAVPDQNNKFGTIESAYEEYNLKHKLFHYVYSSSNTINNEIHDYSTGLNYRFNRKYGTCEINKLTTGIDAIQNGSYIYIRNPNEFFDFDNADYQYVGIKRRDGVNNDVWIGKRLLNGLNATLEWYFMSETWNRTDDFFSDEKQSIPIFVKITVDIPKQHKPTEFEQVTVNNHIFGFTTTPFNLVDYDLSLCDDKLNKKFFIFRFNNDLSHLIKSNKHEFQRALIEVLQTKLRVTLLRISNLQIVFDTDAIFVLFTIYERASFYGPVPIPKDDLLLDDSIKRLINSFYNDEIQVLFKSYDDKQDYEVPAVRESLLEIDNYEEGFIVIDKQRKNAGFSTATVALVTIVVTVIGVVLSLLVVILQRANKINIPLIRSFYA